MATLAAKQTALGRSNDADRVLTSQVDRQVARRKLPFQTENLRAILVRL